MNENRFTNIAKRKLIPANKKINHKTTPRKEKKKEKNPIPQIKPTRPKEP